MRCVSRTSGFSGSVCVTLTECRTGSDRPTLSCRTTTGAHTKSGMRLRASRELMNDSSRPSAAAALIFSLRNVNAYAARLLSHAHDSNCDCADEAACSCTISHGVGGVSCDVANAMRFSTRRLISADCSAGVGSNLSSRYSSAATVAPEPSITPTTNDSIDAGWCAGGGSGADGKDGVCSHKGAVERSVVFLAVLAVRFSPLLSVSIAPAWLRPAPFVRTVGAWRESVLRQLASARAAWCAASGRAPHRPAPASLLLADSHLDAHPSALGRRAQQTQGGHLSGCPVARTGERVERAKAQQAGGEHATARVISQDSGLGGQLVSS